MLKPYSMIPSMKLAFITSSSGYKKKPAESHYTEALVSVLQDSGVSITLVREKSGTNDDSHIENVDYIDYEVSEKNENYWSTHHLISDAIYNKLIEHPDFDVILFPADHGLGFSTIRAKKLLGKFSETRIITNVKNEIDWSEESLESEFLNEMISYSIKYSDQVITPCIKLLANLKKNYLRNDVYLYQSKEPDSQTEQEASLNDADSLEDIESQEISAFLQIEDKKRYKSRKYTAKTTTWIPFSTWNSNEEIHIDDSNQVITYVDKDEPRLIEQYKLFEHENVEKVDVNTITTLQDVISHSTGEMILFASHCDVLRTNYIDQSSYALIHNPNLSYIGASFPNSKKAFGYVSSLMSLVNTCSEKNNLFRTSALNKIADKIDFNLNKNDEWTLISAIHQNYMNGDVLPSSYQVNLFDSYKLSTKEKFKLQKGLSPTVLKRLLKILIDNPELLLGNEIRNISNEVIETSDDKHCQETEDPIINLPSDQKIENEIKETTFDSENQTEEFSESIVQDEEDTIKLEDIDDNEIPSETIQETENKITESTEVEEEEHEKLKIKLPDIDQEIDDPESEEPSKIGFWKEDENDVDFVNTEDLHFLKNNETDESTETEDASHPSSSPLKIADENIQHDSEDIHTSEVAKPEDTKATTIPDLIDDDFFQLFWAKDGAFSEVNSIKKEAEMGIHAFSEFSIDNVEGINTLRLDPCNHPGMVALRSIQILNNETGEIVFAANEENAFDNIQPAGDFEVEGIEADSLVLKSIASDPQIIIELSDINLSDFTVQIEYGYERSE